VDLPIELSRLMAVAFGQSQGSDKVRFFGFYCRFRRLPAHTPTARSNSWRLALYYIYDSIRDTPQQCDSGSKISAALNLLIRGAVSLKEFPYSEEICPRPTNIIRSQASDFRIANWFLVDTRRLDQIKGALALVTL
jgi:hypothetical protein